MSKNYNHCTAACRILIQGRGQDFMDFNSCIQNSINKSIEEIRDKKRYDIVDIQQSMSESDGRKQVLITFYTQPIPKDPLAHDPDRHIIEEP